MYFIQFRSSNNIIFSILFVIDKILSQQMEGHWIIVAACVEYFNIEISHLQNVAWPFLHKIRIEAYDTSGYICDYKMETYYKRRYSKCLNSRKTAQYIESVVKINYDDAGKSMSVIANDLLVPGVDFKTVDILCKLYVLGEWSRLQRWENMYVWPIPTSHVISLKTLTNTTGFLTYLITKSSETKCLSGVGDF